MLGHIALLLSLGLRLELFIILTVHLPFSSCLLKLHPKPPWMPTLPTKPYLPHNVCTKTKHSVPFLGLPLSIKAKTCTAETTVLYKDPLKRRLCCCKTKEVPELFKLVATVRTRIPRALPRTGRAAPAGLLSAEGHPYGGKGRTQLRQGNSDKSLNLVKLSKLCLLSTSCRWATVKIGISLH